MKKKRPDQTGQLVGVRLQPDQLEKLDFFIAKHSQSWTRPEAIRLILNGFFRSGGAVHVAPDGDTVITF